MKLDKTKQQNPKKSFIGTGLQLSLALLIFVLSVLTVRDGQFTFWEETIFHAVYDMPTWMEPFFWIVTQLGNIWILLVIGIVLLVIKRQRDLVLRLFMTGLAAYMVSGICKSVFGRARPDGYIVDLVLRDFAWGPGFPSGHMALATAIMLTLAGSMPKKTMWLVPVLIILVAVSRIYLGVHAPMDVVGGFALGWAVVLVFHILYAVKGWSSRRVPRPVRT